MSLSSEVHDGVDFLSFKHPVHQIRAADISFHELVIGVII